MAESGAEFILGAIPFNMERHYEMFCEWWKGNKGDPPQDWLLPTIGIISTVNGIPSAIGYIVQTDTKACMFEFPCVNPDVDRKMRSAGMDHLIVKIIEVSGELGYNLIYTSKGNRRLIKRLEDQGFINGGERQVHMFKGLV